MRGSRDNRPGEPDTCGSASRRPAAETAIPGGTHFGRLKKRSEFLQAAQGRRAHSRSFSLQMCSRPAPSGSEPEARFGLTVTRKVGGAVERNRIKRRLRAALRSPDLVPDGGHDYVIVARRDALTIPFPRLLADLGAALEQCRRGGSARLGARDKSGRRVLREPGSTPPQ